MKKIPFVLLAAPIVLVAFAGCTKEYITNNHLPGVSYTTAVKTVEWSETNAGSGVYFTDLDFPELDAGYFRYGSVQVAIRFGSAAYHVVPATIDGVHYFVRYAVGVVTLLAEDRYDIPLPPGDMTVKITLTDARNGGG